MVLQEMFGSETPTLCIAIHVGESKHNGGRIVNSEPRMSKAKLRNPG